MTKYKQFLFLIPFVFLYVFSAHGQVVSNGSAVLLEPQADITAIIEMVTTKGNITIGLYGKDAPMTVGNFIGLIKEKFYDSILFHRIVKDFVIQVGDEKTKNQKLKAYWGSGGKSFYGSPFKDELNPEAPSYQSGYQRGVVAMANSGPNTNTSQFFICLTNLSLPKSYTIFGKVLNGMHIVDAIAETQNNNEDIEEVRIISMTIKKQNQ